MAKSASRQKANNANASVNGGKNANATTATPAAPAPVETASAKATAAATQAVKATATVAAAPTREQQSASKNANKNAKNAKNANANADTAPSKNVNVAHTANANPTKNGNANVNATKDAKAFALTDVTAATVQQARQIRKTDFERFQKFHNFFAASDAETARSINAKANVKREQVDQWVGGAVNPKALACIQEVQETQQALLALLIVSAALTKYGEQELARRDALGEMDYVVGARFGTSGLCSKQHLPHNVGVSFVLRLVLGLAPDKRAACETLREILSHESNARLVLTPTNKGLQTATGAAAADSDDWATFHQDQLLQMAKQAQSDKFQEAMQQLGGEHLYDAIRTQLKQAGGASVWKAAKDKSPLQAKNIRPRAGSAGKSVKPQKEAKQQQPAKKNGAPQVQSVKKNLPVEAEKWALVPPPAPVTVKSTTAAPVKKEAAVPKGKAKQAKNAAPEKNAAPVKDGSATVAQSHSGAIVSSARGGRAALSKPL
ncbi:hypothetical protein PHYPSEUDO_002218 [Phytophthora pseudosyringae]|uniref:Uncharacterized protein n=1 Tax=Phytophthora pseudosyringae TaxID=221518 RepID=A0A8T1V5D4_9STRA|nr:hypothetical protein PHYPSEUDO_002218 [Phytophthora pseudosyringae]